MTTTHETLDGSCFKANAMAATIAIRYSAVRRQGYTGNSDNSEMCVLDYAMQQASISPAALPGFGSSGFFLFLAFSPSCL